MIGSCEQYQLHTEILSSQRERFSLLRNDSTNSVSLFKKPSPLGVTAFFPGFISARREVSSAPMNGSLASSWGGRVSLISSFSKSFSREGD